MNVRLLLCLTPPKGTKHDHGVKHLLSAEQHSIYVAGGKSLNLYEQLVQFVYSQTKTLQLDLSSYIHAP